MEKMDLKEFREKGYLQEANRRFFHPLGLQLAVTVDDNDKYIDLQILDGRDDPEGCAFLIEDDAEINKMRATNSFVASEFLKRRDARVHLLKMHPLTIEAIQPINIFKDESIK